MWIPFKEYYPYILYELDFMEIDDTFDHNIKILWHLLTVEHATIICTVYVVLKLETIFWIDLRILWSHVQ